jgi:GNAT superfamily N-acetyltransferase
MPDHDALAARLRGLTPEAREKLLERLRAQRTAPGTTVPPPAAPGATIPRRAPGADVPLSSAQWRLWFLEQMRPGTNAWNTPVAVRIAGALDLELLRRALQLLIDRHDALRTAFASTGGIPHPAPPANLRIDVPVERPDGEPPEAAIERFVAREIARPFDLTRDLLLRTSVLSLGPEDHVLVLVAHHIACDGWSKGLLLQELSLAYGALAAGTDPDLPELALEYADYALWQQQQLSAARAEKLADYWRTRLAGAPPLLHLPADHPRPVIQTFQGAVEWVQLPDALIEPLLAVGRAERATPFMTLMAAFVVLLHAHSGQDDILVGSPAAMRTYPELEHLVGLLANTLVYRTDVSGAPSFRDLLGRVRETALGVYEHQDLPFDRIVHAARPERRAGQNPLVQANLRVEGREPELALGGAEVTPLRVDPGIARFDIGLELAPADGGYEGYLEYDTALFSPETASRLVADFTAIVGACAEAPDAPLETLAPLRAIACPGEPKGRRRGLSDEVEISEPQTDADWQQYNDLRYEILRKPHGAPRGSESDHPLEAISTHYLAKVDSRVVGGVTWVVLTRPDGRGGRCKYARLRQIAVAPEFQKYGIATRLIEQLETNARAQGAVEVNLASRNELLDYYQRKGYEPTGPAGTLFGDVGHTQMVKPL